MADFLWAAQQQQAYYAAIATATNRELRNRYESLRRLAMAQVQPMVYPAFHPVAHIPVQRSPVKHVSSFSIADILGGSVGTVRNNKEGPTATTSRKRSFEENDAPQQEHRKLYIRDEHSPSRSSPSPTNRVPVVRPWASQSASSSAARGLWASTSPQSKLSEPESPEGSEDEDEEINIEDEDPSPPKILNGKKGKSPLDALLQMEVIVTNSTSSQNPNLQRKEESLEQPSQTNKFTS